METLSLDHDQLLKNQEASSKEEGEISEDDEDMTNEESSNGKEVAKNQQSSKRDTRFITEKISCDGILSENGRQNVTFDDKHNPEKQHNNTGGGEKTSSSSRRRKSHIGWERPKIYDDHETSDHLENHQPVSHSKIWENHRLRRASSVRPKSPSMSSRGYSVAPEEEEEEGEDFDKLMREHKRIQEMLKSLECEEEVNKKESKCEEDILGEIGKIPESLPAEAVVSLEVLKKIAIETEDISEDEDFDEQELRRIALATSARHNQLIASDSTKEAETISLGSPKLDEQVVVIPDVESEKKEPEVVVVVEEDENSGKKQSKSDVEKTVHKRKAASSKSRKSHGKRKKKESSKPGDRKSSPSGKDRRNLSKKDWHRQQKVLQVLAEKNPSKAIEKLKNLFKDSLPVKKPITPVLPTGTMGDFKRQNRLPLLSKTQNIHGKKGREASRLESAKGDTGVLKRDSLTGESTKKKQPGTQQDNYEEVEMEIESDKEDNNELSGKPGAAIDTLQLGSDFSQAMQPISSMMYKTAGAMYSLNAPFMPHGPVAPMLYPGPAMIPLDIPLPSTMHIPPPLPPLPFHNPPLPPQPKSPPPIPPPPPCPPPPPLDPWNKDCNSPNAPFADPNTSQSHQQRKAKSILLHPSYSPKALSQHTTLYCNISSVHHENNNRSHTTAVREGERFSTKVVLDKRDEKDKKTSVLDIGLELHRLRKQVEFQDKPCVNSSKSLHSGLEEHTVKNFKLARYDNQIIQQNNSPLEPHSERYLKDRDKKMFDKGLDLCEEKSFRKFSSMSNKEKYDRVSGSRKASSRLVIDYDHSRASHTVDKNNSSASNRSPRGDANSPEVPSDRERHGHTRKHWHDPYSPHNPVREQSHSSVSSFSPSSSRGLTPSGKSPKRRRSASPQEFLRRGKWAGELQCKVSPEYEPRSHHHKHSRHLSPPPVYIPSSKSRASEGDLVQEEADNEEDEEDLRKKLLIDMILKRSIYNQEKNTSSDSSLHDNSSSPGQVDQLAPADETEAIYSKAGVGSEGIETKDRLQHVSSSEEDSDEDPVPPPVMSRVWNQIHSTSVATPESPTMTSRTEGSHHPKVVSFSQADGDDNVPVLDSPSHNTGLTNSSSCDTGTSAILPEEQKRMDTHVTAVLATEGESGVGMSPVRAVSDSNLQQDQQSGLGVLPSNQENLSNSEFLTSGEWRALDYQQSELSHAEFPASYSSSLYEASVPLQLAQVPAALTFTSTVSSPHVISQVSTESVNISQSFSAKYSLPLIPTLLESYPSVPTSTVSNVDAFGFGEQRNVDTYIPSDSLRDDSRPVSSLVSRTGSVDLHTLNRHHSKMATMLVPPIHPSVIVPLQTSSDEDEEDGSQLYDPMNPTKSGDSQTIKLKHLWKEDQKLCIQKKAILSDQEKLRGLLTKVSLYILAENKYEAKTKSLADEIASLLEKKQIAEKMAKAQSELKEKSKRMAKIIKDRLLKQKDEFLEKTKSLVGLGQVLVGPNFFPTALKAGQDSKAVSKPASHPGVSPKIIKAKQIAVEKQVLKEKERKIAEKLKKLKEVSTPGPRFSSVVKPIARLSREAGSETPLSSRTGDIIRLDNKDSIQDISVKRRRRRRSILISESGTTPNLPKTPKSLSTPKSRKEVKSGKDSTETNAFKLPSNPQLANLRKLQEEKVEKVFNNLVPGSESPNTTDPFIMYTRLSEADLHSAVVRHTEASALGYSRPLAYTSPLRCFRAYRFSPFYRTKENLSLVSLSHCHKVNPNCVMCPYDLQGTCNDDNCKQQHPKDYTPLEKEILQDMASYHPQIAGIKDNASTEEIQKGIAVYIDNFIAKHKGRMSLEEMCLILTMEASKVTAGKNPSTATKQRRWRPSPKKEQGLSIHLDRRTSRKKLESFDVSKVVSSDRDALQGEDDLRYFSGEVSDLMSLEAGVMESPHDTKLWLQLSARRQADPNRPVAECLDQALNVLARGLEFNRSSSHLWHQYLKLYQKHSEGTDLPQFCQMALDYAPSYELWMMYLNMLVSYQDKEEACKKALDYLSQEVSGSSPETTNTTQVGEERKEAGNEDEQPVVVDVPESGPDATAPRDRPKSDCLSHQVLEMCVYRVALNIVSGRCKTALTFLQLILCVKKADSSVLPQPSRLLSLLTGSDLMTLWLVYIHVLEWQCLPIGLLGSSSDLPGRIVCKEVELPWSSKPVISTPLESLVSLHLLARKVWTKSKDKPSMEGQYVLVVKSLVSLLLSQQQQAKALSLCQRLVSEAGLVDLWILCASLCHSYKDTESALLTFEKAIAANPLVPKLQFYYSVYLSQKGHKEKALDMMEQFILAHFQDSQSPGSLDPNMLFCQVLKQDEGFSLHKCELKSTTLPNLHKDVYMWMCYCQLLELQGEVQELVEVYERSLSQVEDSSDLVVVWKHYISFLVRCGLLGQLWPDILTRSIISLSTKRRQPSASCSLTMVDYHHSNRVIDTWLQVLPEGQRLDTVEKCLDFLPGNSALLMRGLELCVQMKQTRRAYCWCRMMLAHQERPTSLGFWKIATALAHKEGMQSEVEQFLVGEVETLPLAVAAWKDFLLFEVSQEDKDMVNKILSHCRQLGVNIDGFVSTILSQA